MVRLTSGLVSPDRDFVSDSMAHSLSREPEQRKEILCSGFSLLREHMGFLKVNIDEIFLRQWPKGRRSDR